MRALQRDLLARDFNEEHQHLGGRIDVDAEMARLEDLHSDVKAQISVSKDIRPKG